MSSPSSAVTDLVEILPQNLIEYHLSQIIDSKTATSMILVSKLWNRTLSSHVFWSNVLKDYPFINKLDPMINTDAKQAYVRDKKTIKNIINGSCAEYPISANKLVDNKPDYKWDISSIRQCGNGFSMICDSNILLFDERGVFKLLHNARDGKIAAYTINGTTLSAITRSGDLFVQEFHGVKKIIKSNLMWCGFLTILKDRYIIESGRSTLSSIDISADCISITVNQITDLKVVNDQIVFLDYSGKLKFYDENLTEIRTLFDKADGPYHFLEGYVVNIVTWNYSGNVKLWDHEGNFKNLIDSDYIKSKGEYTIKSLTIMNRFLVTLCSHEMISSSYEMIRIWDGEKLLGRFNPPRYFTQIFAKNSKLLAVAQSGCLFRDIKRGRIELWDFAPEII
ncbi:MAG: hypothetical protein JHC93_07795 [Parachlamydiales bacterium]|nr:hypothetical protein [Parachlamydiales bacterium]